MGGGIVDEAAAVDVRLRVAPQVYRPAALRFNKRERIDREISAPPEKEGKKAAGRI